MGLSGLLEVILALHGAIVFIAVTSVEYIDGPLKAAGKLGSKVLPHDVDMNEHIGHTGVAVIAAETVHLLPA
jgi:hypothetical protein